MKKKAEKVRVVSFYEHCCSFTMLMVIGEHCGAHLH